MATEFPGFPQDSFAFLAELEANNSKAWFDAHRERYEAVWKAPALDFIAAIGPRMAGLTPALRAVPKLNGSLRRINRDVRFSKDKTPYNPSMHLIFWAGDHPNRSAAMHLVLHATGVGYGAGLFGIDPSRLATLRRRISEPGDRAELLDAIAAARSVACDFDEPELKNLPKGFEAEADWEHLLRRKAFVMRTHGPETRPDWIHRGDAIDQVMALTHTLQPLIAWLHR